MYEELLKYVHSIKNAYLNKLLVKFFEEDEEFIKTFKEIQQQRLYITDLSVAC